MLLRPLTWLLASSCLSKLLTFYYPANLSKHFINYAANLAKVTLHLHAYNAAASKCNAASPVRCACWTRLTIIMIRPSAKRSSSIASLASLPLDQAQDAQSHYSLLFFDLWMAQTRHIQRNCFNLQSTAQWSESNAVSTKGIQNSLSLVLITFRRMTYEISSSGHLMSELTNYKCNLVLIKIVCFKVG